MESDPRNKSGPFARLFKDLRNCKNKRTCPSLTLRPYYFEPNEKSVCEWHAEGMYLGKLDPRVVFVCESPGHFDHDKQYREVEQCFFGTKREWKFHKARKEAGLQDCYMTNTVKCGVRDRKKYKRHSDEEIEACTPFLVQELNLMQPVVVVAVGENAMHTLRTKVAHRLDVAPVLFQVAHYSMRRDPEREWKREFPELKRLLSRLEALSQHK